MVVAVGLMITAVGSGLPALVGRASLDVVVTASVVMAVGVCLADTLILDMILAAAPPERAGAATGMAGRPWTRSSPIQVKTSMKQEATDVSPPRCPSPRGPRRAPHDGGVLLENLLRTPRTPQTRA